MKFFFITQTAEIIIVDDNSTDEYTKYYQRKKIQKILNLISRKSRGLASACLTGLLYANYENICWIDSNLPDLSTKNSLNGSKFT